MRIIPPILIFLLALASCRQPQRSITNLSDYEKYLHLPSADSMHSIQRIEADIDFWDQRLKKNPEDAVAQSSLAGLYNARFKAGGDINDIHISDSLYKVANSLFKTNSSSIYRSLASNCITQHKFGQARLYLDTAAVMGDDLYLTTIMQFDVAMELGDVKLGESILNRLAIKDNFDYLIREAKLLDQRGDLEGAIVKMELASQKAIDSRKESLILWAKSNLADMYGHANRYEDAYQGYLDVLDIKSDYLYALKGIAWLAFSNDKNINDAKRILNYISALHPIPDYDLLEAEIAAYQKDNTTEKKILDDFISKTADSRYGDMYNKYIFYVMADNRQDLDKALEIAQAEVNNRPTPESYDLLAWSYYLLGRKDEATKIAKSFVENRNHEPHALYHLAMIYASAGDTKKARQFKKEAEGSAFELGPALAAKIQRDLSSL